MSGLYALGVYVHMTRVVLLLHESKCVAFDGVEPLLRRL